MFLLTHLIFKTTETNRPIHLGILLIVVPSLLTAIVAPHWTSYLKTAAVVFSTFYLTLTSSIVIYRLSPLHPLARHPGPLLCRVSKFYMAFLSLGGKQHIYYTRLHERYGDVVRIGCSAAGPNELSIRDINAIGPIMGPHGFPKGPFWDGRIAASDTKALIALRDSTEHTRRRKPWTRAFNTAALKGYEEIIIKRCTQFVEGVDAEKGAADLSKWISFFTFGGGVEMMRDGDVDGLWHLLEAGQKTSVFMTHVPWFGQLCMGLPGLAEDIKAFIEHSKRCAIERATHGSEYKDLFYHIMNEGGEDADPTTIEEAVSDGAVAIIAGADTTSSVLANFIYFLLVNPQSYKRVQSEIDTLGDEIMDFGKQARLPYLTAALNESLRLYPPVLSGSQRHVDTGTVIGD
ncbi:hypothetical protein H0H93_009462 [Arthromyces matolae]|nr:hypothetical protein H0H93_009462 [Arthromyces matolae]